MKANHLIRFFILRELNTELKNKINDCRNDSKANKAKNRRIELVRAVS